MSCQQDPPAQEFIALFTASLDRESLAPMDPNEQMLMAQSLADALSAARRAWPHVDVNAQTFLPYLAARWPVSAHWKESLAVLHLSDLYLCCACAIGSEVGMRELQTAYFPALDNTLSRIVPSRSRRSEILGELVPLLFLRSEREPRIASYRGRGPLRMWLRSVAVRHALAAGDGSMAPKELVPPVLGTQDPEVLYLKSLYGQEFSAAFAAAVAALTLRQRNLLRQHVLDGVSLDALAQYYRVHRATVARWLATARETLILDTKDRLGRQLGLEPDELRSVLRLIRSQLDIDLQKLLE